MGYYGTCSVGGRCLHLNNGYQGKCFMEMVPYNILCNKNIINLSLERFIYELKRARYKNFEF